MTDPGSKPRAQGVLRLGRTTFPPVQPVVMGIVNRTPDSFFRPGLSWDESAAMARVDQVIAEGADIVDVGGIPAAPGADVDVAEEIRRTAQFIGAVRARYPDVVISVDTWRHETGRAACEAGADLLNDSWGGYDERLAAVAAEFGAGLVCAHAGQQRPRTRPFRVTYADVMADVLDHTLRLAGRAVAAGVAPERIIIDAAHDFGKNTWHSLEVTRRLAEMTETGWPVLVSLSNKDFVGETLNLPPEERLPGTLAATSVCAWLGARIFRVHQVTESRQVVDMVSAIRGDRPPARAVRGLA
jgi:dihydropteroate synthase